ncbi:DUF4345 domain-containing protein [Novipirellula artificiosorum]|uniref:DUF4345 domain-containing protein n=1 Tax=Novipirellula artificiosorum TaxID=2528016 RepID=UPI0018CD7271|nr:DUF4345 domain-containing protein [Novipirellula artificiosorum]
MPIGRFLKSTSLGGNRVILDVRSKMITRAFLIFCAVGLVPIALGYGAMPSASLDALFGITVDTTNLTHIMRAVMGLYFAMVVIWLWGAFSRSMAGPALVACAVFMLGLAAGRLLSFVLDGMPHWLLIVYAVLEIVLGAVAVLLYQSRTRSDRALSAK